MPTDISAAGSATLIGGKLVNSKVKEAYFLTNQNGRQLFLNFADDREDISINYSDLTINGVAPASEVAALMSLGSLSVFTDAGATALSIAQQAMGAANINTANISTTRVRNAMVTVVCGNSIAAQSKHTGTYWNTNGELMLTNALAYSAMRFKRMTASTRADKYGVYGYSGATLATIMADIDTQWIIPLKTSGIVPDMVVGLALLENDVAQGRTVAQMTTSLVSWIRKMQNTWPGVIIHLCTPRPAFTYSASISNYNGIVDYMLSLDNGSTVFVSKLTAYENPANPGIPLSNDIIGSISGTTLTVTNAGTANIRIGAYIKGAGAYGKVSTFGTGAGGVGTYTLTVSSTVASGTLVVCPYTDDTVHPNARGALMNARTMASTLGRIASSWKHPYSAISTNIALEGSQAASGGGSGTTPTSVTVNLGTSTAELPGWLWSATVAPVVGPVPGGPTGSCNFGSLPVSGAVEVSPFMVFQIVSGGANLRSLQLWPRVNDGSGNNFVGYIQDQTGDAEPDWQDGDILTLRTPPLVATSGSITAVMNYIATNYKLAGGSATFRFISQGVNIVSTVNTGSASFTGDGTTTAFTVTHNAGTIPSQVVISPTSADAATALKNGFFISSKTATTFVITLTAAPLNATNNTIDWKLN
jgi:hypothetical protein